MELKNNAVLIFRNDKKNGESHPDWKGQINIEGKYYDIALWEKEGAKGKFFSGKTSEPWQKPPTAEPPASDFDKPALPLDEQTDTDSLPF